MTAAHAGGEASGPTGGRSGQAGGQGPGGGRVGGGGPAAGGAARRRDPRAQLPGPADPGRGRSRRRLARPVAAGRREHGERDRVRRCLLHGGDRQDPRPGPDGADPRTRGRLLAGGHHHRAAGPGLEGGAPRRRGRRLREHQCRGQGRVRPVLYLGQRRADRGLHPGAPGGAVPARPVPGRLRPAGHRPRQHAHLARRMPRARRDQPGRAAPQGGGRARGRAVHPPGMRMLDRGPVAGGGG